MKGLTLACALSAALVGVSFGGPVQAQERFVTIGTGGQTGVYYVAGQSICRFLNLRSYGTDAFLRWQIMNRLKRLKEDDVMIVAEGVKNLTFEELQQACIARGMPLADCSSVLISTKVSPTSVWTPPSCVATQTTPCASSRTDSTDSLLRPSLRS